MGDGWAWVSLGAYGSAISADDLSRQCLKGRLTDKMTCWRLLNFRAYQQAGICTASSRNCRVILGDTGSAYSPFAREQISNSVSGGHL